MAADPKNATIYARGIRSGAVYAVDMYLSDVASALATFDGGAGAGAASPNFYTFPEDSVIYDLSITLTTANTFAAPALRLTGDGRPSPSILRSQNHMSNLNNRPPLGIKVRAGTRITAIQSA